MKKWLALCLITPPAFLVLSAETPGMYPRTDIPYAHALAAAAVRVDDLSNILDGSLIIGNGDVNALVYLQNGNLVMNLTKNDVWDARILTEKDPPIPTLDLIRRLGASDTAFPMKDNNSGFVLPEGETWPGPDSYHETAFPCPRQCGRIIFTVKDKPLAARSVRGELDLFRAKARIMARNGDESEAEIHALAHRNIFLVKSAAAPALAAIESAGLPGAETGTVNGVYWLRQQIPGDPDWPGMQFAVAAAHKAPWTRIAIVSSLESNDVVRDAIALAGEELDPDVLIRRHEAVWRQFWRQSGIEIDDQVLQSTWYRSLYYLRCFSKPGVQSVGLFAGLINDTPEWHGDYHTNYNIQQTYWGAFAANHPDLAEPYDRLVFDYLPRARWLAGRVYSLPGAYYPHVLFAYEPADPLTCKSRNGRQYIHHTWGMTLGVNGFSVQPLWQRYKYDPDPKRLATVVYPAIRDAALFYAGFIEQCEGGAKVRLGPSVSPEHWGWTKGLKRNYNCAFDIAMIRYTLEAAVEAAGILGKDAALAQRFRSALSRLPDYPRTGDREPVVVDVEGAPVIEYNMPVPSTPVFPGDVVSWWSDEQEKELFQRTIERLKWNGNNATFMLAVARARLSMAGAQDWLRKEVLARLRSNGTLSLNILVPHQRFNDFGHYTEQFSAALAVSELLVQSVDDVIRIFPALAPGARARFTDLRCQGGFLASAETVDGVVKDVRIHSLYGGTLRLASPWAGIQMQRAGETAYRALEKDERGIVETATKARETLFFKGR